MTLVEKILKDNAKANATGVLVICTSTKRALINKRSNLVPTPNTWATFGGMVDDTDTSNENACKRELSEEAGFKGSMKLITAYLYKKDDFKYQNYIGLVEKEFTPSINEESTDYVWCNWQELYEIEPKHYGLDSLLENSVSIIEKYLTPTLTEKILKEAIDFDKKLIKDLENKVFKFNILGPNRTAKGFKRELSIVLQLAKKFDPDTVAKIYKAVKTYTGTNYARMNNSLRVGKLPNNTELIDNYIKYSNKLDANILYRGVSAGFFSTLKLGDTFTEPSFLSTTTDLNIAISFSKKNKVGGVLYISNVNNLGVKTPEPIIMSDNSGEHEFLLPRGLKFKVLSIDKNKAQLQVIK